MEGLGFPRREGVNRQRMHAAGEFPGERLIDQAMAVDPALAFERLGHDMNPVMAFSTGTMARVPRMLMGFVLHPQA